MAYISFTTGGIKNGQAVIGTAPNATQVYTYGTIPDSTVDVFTIREGYYAGSFNVGTGLLITTAGRVIYDALRDGRGLLQNLLLVNRGNNTIYFGVNTSGMHINSGTALASGESFNFEDPVRSVWAITSTSDATISAQGNYRQE